MRKKHYRSGEEIQIGDLVSLPELKFCFKFAIVSSIKQKSTFPIRISSSPDGIFDFPTKIEELKLLKRNGKEWLTWL